MNDLTERVAQRMWEHDLHRGGVGYTQDMREAFRNDARIAVTVVLDVLAERAEIDGLSWTGDRWRGGNLADWIRAQAEDAL